jgi:hypothetical protein
MTLHIFKRLIEGTVTAKVLPSQERREKEGRKGESQPFRERTLTVEEKIHLGQKSNPQPSGYKADAQPFKLTRLANIKID